VGVIFGLYDFLRSTANYLRTFFAIRLRQYSTYQVLIGHWIPTLDRWYLSRPLSRPLYRRLIGGTYNEVLKGVLKGVLIGLPAGGFVYTGDHVPASKKPPTGRQDWCWRLRGRRSTERRRPLSRSSPWEQSAVLHSGTYTGSDVTARIISQNAPGAGGLRLGEWSDRNPPSPGAHNSSCGAK